MTPEPFIERLLSRCTFYAPGTDCYAAVSGGPDSLALLVLATAAGCNVTAIHIDHGLREGSSSEADVVRSAAERFGAEFRAERVEISHGPNLEARARWARKAVLPEGSMTGHTADDQAETVLLNLVRGTGLDGLVAMRPGPTKPILALRRSEAEALCAEVGLTPVDDPSNRDPAFTRNRIRHEVLPLLDEIATRDVAALTSRTASLLGDDAEFLSQLAEQIDPTDAKALALSPLPLSRRAVRKWLAHEVPPYPPNAAVVDRVLAVANGQAKAAEVGGGVTVLRTQGRLRIEMSKTPKVQSTNPMEVKPLDMEPI